MPSPAKRVMCATAPKSAVAVITPIPGIWRRRWAGGSAAAPRESHILAAPDDAWYGLQTSATFQSYLLPQDTTGQGSITGLAATRTYTSAEVQSGVGGLGRPLNGVMTRALHIVAPATLYEGRLYQVDWRLVKNVKTGRVRIQPQLDIYNLFNNNIVLGQSSTFGANWRRPTTILQGRTFKFGIQVDF